MLSLSKGRCVFILLCLLAASSALAQGSNELLVRARDGLRSTAQQATADFGKIVGVDQPSGLLRLRLSDGLNVRRVKHHLLLSRQVTVAISSRQSEMDLYSYESVSDRVIYQEEVKKHSKARDGERSEKGADWLDAYRYWLKDRVDQTGTVNYQKFIEGAKHRDQMPVARVPLSNGEIQPLIPSGTWSYVGPKNLSTTPYVLYSGPTPIAGRVSDIAINPNDHNIIYVATAGGGVWKTIDGGVNWLPLSDGPNWPIIVTSSIAIDPVNPSNIYVGTGDYHGFGDLGFGIMKSTDGGATWTNYGATAFAGLSISHVMVDPTSPSHIVATAGRSPTVGGGIFISVDSGVTWTQVANAQKAWYDGLDLSVDDGTGKRIFWAIGSTHLGGYIYASADHGVTWTPVTTPDGGPNGSSYSNLDLACSKQPGSSGTVYVLGAANPPPYSARHIWKTIDGGATWTDIFPTLASQFPSGYGGNPLYNWNQYWYDWYIRTSMCTNNFGTSDTIYVGLLTVAGSFDGGTLYRDVGAVYRTGYGGTALAITHSDQHCLAVDPSDPNTVLIGNDGGIYRCTTDPFYFTSTCTPLNANLGISQFYKIGLHPNAPGTNILMGGTQDNSSPASLGDLNNWANEGSGDGGQALYDPYNPLIAYSSAQYNVVYHTTHGWSLGIDDLIARGSTTFGAEPANFSSTLALSPLHGSAPSTLFAGTDHLWSFDGSVWTADLGGQQLASGLYQGNPSTVRTIAMCQGNYGWLYSGSDTSEIWFSQNFGSNWVGRKDNSVFTGPITGICPRDSNSYDLLVSEASTNSGSHLYRCADASATSPVWTSVAGIGITGLPDVPINCVVRDPFRPDKVWYVATDVGVFMTQDAGGTWANLSNVGLPHVAVYDLQFSANQAWLYAGTFGRGIWKIKIQNPALIALKSVQFVPTSVVGGVKSLYYIGLNMGANYGGVKVTMTSDSAYAVIQPNIVFSNGFSSEHAPVYTTSPPTTIVANITTHLGTQTMSAALTITPGLSALTIPATLHSNANTTGTVTLSGVTTVNTVVTLRRDTGYLIIPATVTVLAGNSSATFSIKTGTISGSLTGHITAYTGTLSFAQPVSLSP